MRSCVFAIVGNGAHCFGDYRAFAFVGAGSKPARVFASGGQGAFLVKSPPEPLKNFYLSFRDCGNGKQFEKKEGVGATLCGRPVYNPRWLRIGKK